MSDDVRLYFLSRGRFRHEILGEVATSYGTCYELLGRFQGPQGVALAVAAAARHGPGRYRLQGPAGELLGKVRIFRGEPEAFAPGEANLPLSRRARYADG